MALFSKSSIAEWLHFNGTDLVVPSCQYVNYTGHLEYDEEGAAFVTTPPVVTNASCAQVCSDSASLFASQSSNLVACGLWSTVLSAYTFLSPENALSLNQNNNSMDLFDQFDEVGLDTNVLEYAYAYAHTISSCLQLLYYNAKFFTFSDDGTTAAACTRIYCFLWDLILTHLVLL